MPRRPLEPPQPGCGPIIIEGSVDQKLVLLENKLVPRDLDNNFEEITSLDSGCYIYVDDNGNPRKMKASSVSEQVNADWNATSGKAMILNKPTLGALSAKDKVAWDDLNAEVKGRILSIENDIEDLDDSVDSIRADVTHLSDDITHLTASKQDKLIAGDNITMTPTAEGVVISASGGQGTGNYNDLSNKPKINGVELFGDKTAAELGIVIPTNVSAFNNDAGYLTQHQSLKTINNQSLVGTGNIEIESKLAAAITVQNALGKYKVGDNIPAGTGFEEILRNILTKQMYNITVVQGANGTISCAKTSAAEGESVSVVCTPNTGYKLKNITVNGVAKSGTSFTMPAQDVTVSAVFEVIAAAIEFYYGASTNLPTTNAGLAKSEYTESQFITSAGIEKHISCGILGQDDQYMTIAFPNGYALDSVTSSGIPITDNMVRVTSQTAYNLYHYADKNYDVEDGGTDYVFKFSKV